MKRLLIAVAALVCACGPPAADNTAAADGAPQLAAVSLPVSDGAGNRMEALTQDGERWCSEDGLWCVSAGEGQAATVAHGAIIATLPVSGEGRVGVWPVLIRRDGAGDAYVGLIHTVEQMYSGGGGSAASVTIYEIVPTDPGLRAAPVATLPLNGAADIRACFDEEDERLRAGACRDMYSFVARVSLDESVASGSPRIVLETAAASYPGRVTRQADSLEAAPLQESDLVWATDENCSYRRIFSRGGDALNGVYAPDQPLPDCGDYLEP